MRKLVFPAAIIALFGCMFLALFVTSGLRLGGAQVADSADQAAPGGALGPAEAQIAGQVSFRPEYAEIVQSANGQSCTPRNDILDGNPEWRSDIPPIHFESVSGFTYPMVGELNLVHQETGTVRRIPILAGEQDGALSYAVSNLMSGEYRLRALLFYRHPLSPPGSSPHLYSMIEHSGGAAQEIGVRLPAGSALTALDLRLRLTGDVCAGAL